MYLAVLEFVHFQSFGHGLSGSGYNLYLKLCYCRIRNQERTYIECAVLAHCNTYFVAVFIFKLGIDGNAVRCVLA